MYTTMTGTITTGGVTGITIGTIGTIDTNYPLRLNSTGEKGTDVAGQSDCQKSMKKYENFRRFQ